ncbi:antitoxin VbhA family protein [Pseudomonas fluorescens]|nr:antitoxin VbhA family protein [Pseudomonas fluorescens]
MKLRNAISDEERKRRQKAVDYARASIELSGFSLGSEDEVRAQAFVNGDLDLSDFVRATAPSQLEDVSRASPEAAAERSPSGRG